jgi:hypothetical protein
MTFAHLAEAHNKLIASLDEVRKRREAGADDWRYSLLRTFRQYCVAIGIERALIDPVQAMLLEIAETVVSGRRRPGPGAPPLPLNEAACLTMAAASVTVLKERGDFDSISAAVQAASKASGLDLLFTIPNSSMPRLVERVLISVVQPGISARSSSSRSRVSIRY